MAKATSIRINETLYAAADRSGRIQKRSISKQIELWAELGRTIEPLVTMEDALSIVQGLKKIEVFPAVSKRVDPESVAGSLEKSRKDGTLKNMVTKASVYYEASLNSPGLIDRVDTKTGERQTGRFEGGEFLPL